MKLAQAQNFCFEVLPNPLMFFVCFSRFNTFHTFLWSRSLKKVEFLWRETAFPGGDSHTRFPLGISFPAGSGLVAFAAATGVMPLNMPESVLVRFSGSLDAEGQHIMRFQYAINIMATSWILLEDEMWKDTCFMNFSFFFGGILPWPLFDLGLCLKSTGKMQPGVTLRDLVHAIPYYAIQQAPRNHEMYRFQMFFHSTCKYVLWFWLLMFFLSQLPMFSKSWDCFSTFSRFWIRASWQWRRRARRTSSMAVFWRLKAFQTWNLEDIYWENFLRDWMHGKSGFRRMRSLRIKRCCSIKLWKDNKCQNIAGDFWYPRKCEQAFELSDASAERSAAGCTIKLNKVAAFEGSLDICIIHTDVCFGSL